MVTFTPTKKTLPGTGLPDVALDELLSLTMGGGNSSLLFDTANGDTDTFLNRLLRQMDGGQVLDAQTQKAMQGLGLRSSTDIQTALSRRDALRTGKARLLMGANGALDYRQQGDPRFYDPVGEGSRVVGGGTGEYNAVARLLEGNHPQRGHANQSGALLSQGEALTRFGVTPGTRPGTGYSPYEQAGGGRLLPGPLKNPGQTGGGTLGINVGQRARPSFPGFGRFGGSSRI